MIEGKLIGNPNIDISSFSNIENAAKGDVTFLADMRYKKYINSTKASLIIVPRINIKTKKTIIEVDNPAEKFIEILTLFSAKKAEKQEISQSAKIHPNSKIAKNVCIGENSVIHKNTKINMNCTISSNTFIGENTQIGCNTKIGPNVTIYPNTEIGENCIIHAGVVIGSEGFGFIQKKDSIIKIPQIGKTIIKNNVEIGSNTTIDRGTFNNTTINSGVKLDNLIQVGHNVTIGENTIIAAQTGIAGSTNIGKNCMIGGQVAISDHITIGNNVKIAGKSGVIKNIPNNKTLQGHLAFDIKDFQKSYIHFKNLTQIVSEIEQLKEKNKIAKNNSK
tara:strand:+ start:4647 stop:5645 length:999 start_codon:yes stop_codon:yes gene_type:complete